MAPELVFLELGAIPGSLAELLHSSRLWRFHPVDTQKGGRRDLGPSVPSLPES